MTEATAPPQGRAAPARASLGARAKQFGLREFVLLPALVVAIIVGSIVSDAFLTWGNIVAILQQSSELSIVVIAEVIILLAGRFDLSLESTVGLAPMVAAWLLVPVAAGGSGAEISPVLAILLVLAVGAAVGAFNGFLVVKLALNAFIVTLAVLILLRGITLGISNGKTLYGMPDSFLYLGSASWLGMPVSLWFAGAAYLLFGAFLRYHSFGRAIYATGGSEEAARAAGIRVDRLVWIVFIIGGVLAAIAGLMLTGRLSATTADQGRNLIFTVFAAAVIGGISLNGGRGRLLGALTGVLLLGVMSNILTLSQIKSFWIDASFGFIILVALVLTRVTGGRSTID